MNYIVLDLEATCKENDRSFPNETIEIGAVKLDSDFNIISTYNKFIKPKLNPVLTQFCKDLTSITQADIDSTDFQRSNRGLQGVGRHRRRTLYLMLLGSLRQAPAGERLRAL